MKARWKPQTKKPAVSSQKPVWPLASFSACRRLWVASAALAAVRSEEHTSELQSLMRISYAVFCLKKKKKNINCTYKTTTRRNQHHKLHMRPRYTYNNNKR